MPAELNITANENGTIGVNIKFYDDDNKLCTPNEAKWTLLDKDYNVVNGNQNVSVLVSTDMNVALYGDDLKPGTLYFSIFGTYDSKTLGNNLPYSDWAKFYVNKDIT